MTESNNQQPTGEPIQTSGPNGAEGQKTTVNVSVPAQKQKTSGMAVAGLVLGILAILFSFIPILNLGSFIFVILGVIFGIVGIIGTGPGKKAGRGIAIAALAISLVACLITVVMYATAGSISSGNTTTAVTEVVEEGTESSSSSANDAAASTQSESSSAAAGDTSNDTYKKATDSQYAVTINSCKRTKDYSGAPAIVVSYTWTNNSDSDQSFMTAITDKAFQDGVELEAAILTGSTDSNSMKSIKPGKSLKVTQAFKLDDTKAPVTIECEELINFGDALLAKKTFDLK